MPCTSSPAHGLTGARLQHCRAPVVKYMFHSAFPPVPTHGGLRARHGMYQGY